MERDDAMFHQACAAGKLGDDGWRQAGNGQSIGQPGGGALRKGEVSDTKAMANFNLKATLCLRSPSRRKARDVEKVLKERKEGT